MSKFHPTALLMCVYSPFATGQITSSPLLLTKQMQSRNHTKKLVFCWCFVPAGSCCTCTQCKLGRCDSLIRTCTYLVSYWESLCVDEKKIYIHGIWIIKHNENLQHVNQVLAQSDWRTHPPRTQEMGDGSILLWPSKHHPITSWHRYVEGWLAVVGVEVKHLLQKVKIRAWG